MALFDDFFEVIRVRHVASRTFVRPVSAVVDPQVHVFRHLERGVVIDTAALIFEVDNECIDVCLLGKLEVLFEVHAGSDVDAVDLIMLDRLYFRYFRKRSPVRLGKIVLRKVFLDVHTAGSGSGFCLGGGVRRYIGTAGSSIFRNRNRNTCRCRLGRLALRLSFFTDQDDCADDVCHKQNNAKSKQHGDCFAEHPDACPLLFA